MSKQVRIVGANGSS